MPEKAIGTKTVGARLRAFLAAVRWLFTGRDDTDRVAYLERAVTTLVDLAYDAHEQERDAWERRRAAIVEGLGADAGWSLVEEEGPHDD